MSLTLHSDRLTLTPYATSDADIAVDLFTDPDVRRYAGGAMDAREILDQMPTWARRGGDGCIGIWCVSLRATGEKLGTVALLPMPVDEHETDWSLVVPGRLPDADIEIGYFLKKSAWGQGFATEACTRLLRFVFEASPLEQVVATFDEDNHASRNVLLKTGFTDRGKRRSYGNDGPYFRITRQEWLALPPRT